MHACQKYFMAGHALLHDLQVAMVMRTANVKEDSIESQSPHSSSPMLRDQEGHLRTIERRGSAIACPTRD
jgi:hypothetical protein